MNVDELFEDGELREYILKSQQNNWIGTHFEHYVSMSTKRKGELGEKLVTKRFRKMSISCEKPTNTGHDRIFGGIKTEIKFSLATSPTWKKKDHPDRKLIVPDHFTFNHIACGKDWERFVFCGVNPSDTHDPTKIRIKPTHRSYPDLRLYFMEKKDFLNYMHRENTDLFKRQQGGAKGGNDDWMLMGMNKFYRLIDLPFVREVKGNW